MIDRDSDAAVLAFLRAEGPGAVTAAQIAKGTGLSRAAARTSVLALDGEGLICTVQWAGDWGTGEYEVRHLHSAPGPCGHSLGCVIQEEGAS